MLFNIGLFEQSFNKHFNKVIRIAFEFVFLIQHIVLAMREPQTHMRKPIPFFILISLFVYQHMTTTVFFLIPIFYWLPVKNKY